MGADLDRNDDLPVIEGELMDDTGNSIVPAGNQKTSIEKIGATVGKAAAVLFTLVKSFMDTRKSSGSPEDTPAVRNFQGRRMRKRKGR